jgi:hypothetical protein
MPAHVGQAAMCVDVPSYPASLDLTLHADRIRLAPPTVERHFPDVSTALHRFEELIAGRPYLIEVASVAKDRWRACLVRLPGVPTALMPFYGPTPREAADALRQWLTRAHERASSGAPRV